MNYLQYKKMTKDVLVTKNADAICYFMENVSPMIDNRIRNHKYTHSDLTKEETIQLLRMNNLNDDDHLIGGEVMRVLGDVKQKKLILKKVDEIELFVILHQIDWIISHRKNN